MSKHRCGREGRYRARDRRFLPLAAASILYILATAGADVVRSGDNGFDMRNQGMSSDYWIDGFHHWIESFDSSTRE